MADGSGGRVTSVPTGDALGLEDGRLVKLAGVEAPKGEADYADVARDALSAAALGRAVRLAFAGAHEDAYGRVLAHVRRAGDRLWLERAMLERGAARVRTTVAARAMAAPMLQAEAEARRARRGLWALQAYRVKLPEELSPDDEGLQIVEGRVRRAGETHALAYLDFSEDWRGAASIEIPQRALKDFRAAGLDPLSLEGRLVRVRGEARRLRLTLDHPEALELLRDG